VISEWIYFRYWGFKEFHDSCLKEITSKTESMLEPVAFYTDDKKLGTILEKTRMIDGKVKWLAAKFISRSLSQVFSRPDKVSFHLEKPKEYSEFLTQVMLECDTSIWWTCPYTPKKWFEYLCQNTDGTPDTKKQCKVLKGEISINDMPSHFVWFVKLNQLSRRRVVIIKDDEWDELTDLQNETYFKEFIKFIDEKSRDKILRFVKNSDLTSAQKPWGNGIPWDYGIYDNAVLIKWEEQSKCCELILSIETSHRNIFNAMLTDNDFKTSVDIQNEIDARKQ
jgi:hypothetical protein